jgi:hypothetical protein
MADQSRDLSWERLGWTRWASANPRAEVTQDQLAPRLLDPPSAEVAHSVLTLRASGTRYVRNGEQGSYIERGHSGGFKHDCSRVLLQPSTPYSHAFEGFYSDFLKRTNRVVGFGERGMPP